MAKEIKELLDEEIKSQLEDLSEFQVGSETKSKAIDDFIKLYRLKIEDDKIEVERNDKSLRREDDYEFRAHDQDLKYKQFNDQKKDRIIRVVIAGVELVVPLIFYGVWMNKGFKFEETGAYTSATFKNLFNRFRPTKK